MEFDPMLDSILGFIGKGIDAYTSNQNAKANRESQERLAAQNIAHQKEFAQQGVRWKVEDAKAAGLHPLAALGAQTTSFSNVVGSDVSSSTNFGGMGQDLGRAIDAGSTRAERQDRMGQAVSRVAQVFSLEKMNLENELLKSQIAKTNATLPPPFPGPAQLAHLSRSPTRTLSGSVMDSKQSEQEQETPQSTKIARWYGVPLETPNWHSSGQVWDDILGDDFHAKLFNFPPLAIHNIYKNWPSSMGGRSGGRPPKYFPYIGQ